VATLTAACDDVLSTAPAVKIQGKSFTVASVVDAINVLQQANGTAVKGPLQDVGNPLAVLSVAGLAQGHIDAHKGKARIRRAVIAHLQDVLLGAAVTVPPATNLKVTLPDPPITGKIDIAALYFDAPKKNAKKPPATPANEFVIVDYLAAAQKTDDPGPHLVQQEDGLIGLAGVELDDEEPEDDGSDHGQHCVYGQVGCDCKGTAAPKPQKPTIELPKPPAESTYVKKGILEYNDVTGYARQRPKYLDRVNNGDWNGIYDDLRKHYGGVVAAKHGKFTYEQHTSWTQAWYSGDLRTCWEIEQTHGPVHADHPGSPEHPETNHVIWEPVIHGELPAGVLPDGLWPSPRNLQREIVDNYILAAHLAKPTSMPLSMRRSWVMAHMTGNKVLVDLYSRNALLGDTFGGSAVPQHTPGDLVTQQPLAKIIAVEPDPERWPPYAIDAYLTENPDCIPASTHFNQRTKAIREHLAKCRMDELRKALVPTYTAAADQPKLSGYHTKLLLTDQHGTRWLFKPAAEGRRFRADVEHHAHRLARRWGYRTAESRLIEHDGTIGQAQRLFTVAHDLTGWTGTDFLKLTPAQLSQLAREHLLDWVIDNDDTHGENVIVTTDGDVIGIDKGRAWRYFGAWPGLAGTTTANTNCQLIYTALYTAIAKGILSQDVIDGVYRDVIAHAHRMQQLPDDEHIEIITAAQEHRPHYNAPTYQKPNPIAPTSLQELLTAATARKHSLVTDMQQLWTGIYTRAGWTLPDLDAPGPPARNSQDHQLHSGLHDPALHEAVARTRNYGTATFVAGRHIEDAHILLWRERHSEHGLQLRGHFKLRDGDVFTAVHKYCKARVTLGALNITGPEGELVHPKYAEYFDTILAAAKDILSTGTTGFLTSTKVQALTPLRRTLRQTLAELQATDEPDPDNRRAAERLIANRYVAYILRLEEAAIYRWTLPPIESFTPLYWLKPAAPDPDDPATISYVKCHRRRSGAGTGPSLDPDGELIVTDQLITDTDGTPRGQSGYMYVVTLATGETIEFRPGKDDGNHLAAHGTIEFTVPNYDDLAASLQRIQTQLDTMGCPIQPATTHDLELFYWRHLIGILDDRADTHRTSGAHTEFWKAVAAAEAPEHTSTQELAALRAAFAHLATAEQIDSFVAAGHHLPRFMHMDLRAPHQPCGKPYWERFDLTAKHWNTKCTPLVQYRSGPSRAACTGVSLSTEARTRTLGIWKTGLSSVSDLTYGSGSFVFVRQNHVNPETFASYGMLFHPRVLARTHNYAYNSDHYGRTCNRKQAAYWDWETTTSHDQSNNELMIKEALSILDDTELMVFTEQAEYERVLKLYADLGITHIRGLPVSARMCMHTDAQVVRLHIEHIAQHRLNS